MKCNHHPQGVSLLAVGHATSFMLAISFVLCVGFDLIFPNHAMYETWQKLLPGFEWISWKSFFIGMIEAYGYGWYFSLLWVPVYNFVRSREKQDHHSDG